MPSPVRKFARLQCFPCLHTLNIQDSRVFFRLLSPDWSIHISGVLAVCKARVVWFGGAGVAQCSWIPGPGVICGLSLLLVLALLRGFFSGSPVFLPPQKPTFLNSNSIGNSRATGLSVEDCCVSPSLNKVDLFIYLIYLKGLSQAIWTKSLGRNDVTKTRPGC